MPAPINSKPIATTTPRSGPGSSNLELEREVKTPVEAATTRPDQDRDSNKKSDRPQGERDANAPARSPQRPGDSVNAEKRGMNDDKAVAKSDAQGAERMSNESNATPQTAPTTPVTPPLTGKTGE